MRQTGRDGGGLFTVASPRNTSVKPKEEEEEEDLQGFRLHAACIAG